MYLDLWVETLLDLLPFKKHLSEMLFFRYFPLKNTSIERLFKDFLEKTNEKIAISYRHFLKGNKSINELNRGLQAFHQEVLNDFIASQRLEVAIVTFGSSISTIQEPSLLSNFQMPTLSTSGTTKLVDAVRLGMDLIDTRKQWYKQTGQSYYRPMMILITDGEPDSDQDMGGLSIEVRNKVDSKSFTLYALGVEGYNHTKLASITPTHTPPMKLKGLAFSEFFKWLSNSIGVITKSKEGDILSLPPASGWAQMIID